MMFTILEVSVYYPNPISVTYVQLVIHAKTAPFLEQTYSTFNFKYSRLNECMNTNRTGNVSRFIDIYLVYQLSLCIRGARPWAVLSFCYTYILFSMEYF